MNVHYFLMFCDCWANFIRFFAPRSLNYPKFSIFSKKIHLFPGAPTKEWGNIWFRIYFGLKLEVTYTKTPTSRTNFNKNLKLHNNWKSTSQNIKQNPGCARHSNGLSSVFICMGSIDKLADASACIRRRRRLIEKCSLTYELCENRWDLFNSTKRRLKKKFECILHDCTLNCLKLVDF